MTNTSLPRPTPSQAKRNRAARAAKMAKANPGRRAAMDEMKRQKQLERALAQMQKDALKAEQDLIREEKKRIREADKEYVRAEKKRIRDEVRQERLRIASEKRKRKKPAAKAPVINCSHQAATDLSLAIVRLAPTANEISQLTHAEYTKLRSDMSKRLSEVRVYAQKCSPRYVAKKRVRAAPKPQFQQPLMFKNHDVHVPDIFMHVPDEDPIYGKEDARLRLINQNKRMNTNPGPSNKPRKKKRIQPQLVG